VMDDEKINSRRHGFLEGNCAGIDCGADPRHGAIIGDLQSVERSGGILERSPACAIVAILDEVLEEGGHAGEEGGKRPGLKG
jgi:hypothetical protein